MKSACKIISSHPSSDEMYEDYHRRSRGPSCTPMTAQSAIAAPYQTAMNGIVSLMQTQRVSGSTESPATIPAMTPQSFNRIGAPLGRAQIDAANGIAGKNIMRRRQRAEDASLQEASLSHAWGRLRSSIATAAAMAAKKGNKTSAQFVAFSRPGRAGLSKGGAPVPITRAKRRFTANHSR
jgi:hypothetical protein